MSSGRASSETNGRSRAALLAQGRRTKLLVDAAILYDETPRWLLPVAPLPADVDNGRTLRSGLATLVKTFGFRPMGN